MQLGQRKIRQLKRRKTPAQLAQEKATRTRQSFWARYWQRHPTRRTHRAPRLGQYDLEYDFERDVFTTPTSAPTPTPVVPPIAPAPAPVQAKLPIPSPWTSDDWMALFDTVIGGPAMFYKGAVGLEPGIFRIGFIALGIMTTVRGATKLRERLQV